eukprot:7565333-Heterocapsa_arctica.AAC.1
MAARRLARSKSCTLLLGTTQHRRQRRAGPYVTVVTTGPDRGNGPFVTVVTTGPADGSRPKSSQPWLLPDLAW